jgi:hypothetical protein
MVFLLMVRSGLLAASRTMRPNIPLAGASSFETPASRAPQSLTEKGVSDFSRL